MNVARPTLLIEPVAALSALFMCVRMAKLTDPDLAEAFSSLEARSRATKSSEKAAWAALYREAAELMPKVVAHQARLDRERDAAQASQATKQRLGQLAMSLPSGLSRAAGDWSARLAQQERETLAKAQKAIDALEVTSLVDPKVGELVFRFEPAMVDRFWEWLRAAEAGWTQNNAKLVAVRATECIQDVLLELPAGVTFEVGPAPLEPPRFEAPRLEGSRIPNPTFFQSLGSTYRFVMSAVTAVSGLGFFATRVVGAEHVSRVLPIGLGSVFLITVVVAALTIPKERRQTMARFEARARDALTRELSEAIRERLKIVVEAQSAAIKRHLNAEGLRFKSAHRDPSGDVRGPQPSFAAMAPGILPADIARMRGEWKAAIEARIAELEAPA